MGGLRLLSNELAALGLDLQSSLREEPRLLWDSRFLGALHDELREQLGGREADAALLQLGFLHGLRDALQVVLETFGHAARSTAPVPSRPRLTLHLVPGTQAEGFALAGSWPERFEAEAILGAVGPGTAPRCRMSTGYTSGWLSGIHDADLLAVERRCAVRGDPQCHFDVREASAWDAEAQREPEAQTLLEALPFAALRDVVARHLETAPASEPARAEAFEPGSAVVHVWGPVMVIPFSGAEEASRTLELIARDPGARGVRVVIVDLAGAILDEGFGAVALEQVLDAIEGWGAEPVLTGVSPLSQGLVADLERSHLLIHKDLPEAIAAGFQIARALQRAS